ncbi:hypothetical protein NL676_004577 [Syzygium grande]|nr:hypothetical protein NL676_004577 [Syzygium grande]
MIPSVIPKADLPPHFSLSLSCTQEERLCGLLLPLPLPLPPTPANPQRGETLIRIPEPARASPYSEPSRARGWESFDLGRGGGSGMEMRAGLRSWSWSWSSVVCASWLALATLRLAGANSEGDALYTFRRSLSDRDNVLQSWDPTLVNPCTWFHITCNQDNRVTRVDLGNSNLSGHLVPELGKLEHLQYLELYKNNIQGTIPTELGNLKSLVSLDLYNNNITGNIPPSLGKLKSLVFLRLNDNKLTGPIPRELVGISSLKVVDVSNNNLCGTIPTTGPFEHIPLNNFENNPRLEGPELLGLASYDTNFFATPIVTPHIEDRRRSVVDSRGEGSDGRKPETLELEEKE